jgi:MscS family membrane protein
VATHEHRPSDQPRAPESGIPVDDLDRGTPRRAVLGFRQAVRAHNYRRAAEYLDLQQLPAEDAKLLGPQLARQLKIVIDQQIPIDVDRLSDSASGYLDDGLPLDLEQLGRIETSEMPVNMRLQRVPREDGVKIWKLSAASVAAIPDLYQRYGYGLLGEALPNVFNETSFLDTPLRQWVALPILIGVGYGLGLLITTLGLRLLRRRRSELASVLSSFVVGPVQLLVIVLFLAVAHRFLQPSVIMDRILMAVEQIVLIIAIAWMILRVVEPLEEIARNHALRRDDYPTPPAARGAEDGEDPHRDPRRPRRAPQFWRQRHHRPGGAGHRRDRRGAGGAEDVGELHRQHHALRRPAGAGG